MAAADAGGRSALAGVEVPIPGCDRIRWTDVTVPSSSVPPEPPPSSLQRQRDASGCYVVGSGDSAAYLVWWIHKEHPNVVEVIELSGSSEPPCNGLRVVFNEALRPFAFICSGEVGADGRRTCILYTLTLSGIAYLCKLYTPFSYNSGSSFSTSDVAELDVKAHAPSCIITAAAAKPGCLLLGMQDGSVRCFQLGKSAQNAPGLSYELRDDVGIGRIWNFVSRGRAVGPVQDMVYAKACQKDLLFVLHVDESLRLWDLSTRAKIFSHNVSSNELQGSPARMWVGEVNSELNLLAVAILYHVLEVEDTDQVVVYNFTLSISDKTFLFPDPSTYTICFSEEQLIDLKIDNSKIWVLKKCHPESFEIVQYDYNMRRTCSYILQESLVCEQLFQTSNPLEDLIWNIDSLSALSKEQSHRFVSSVFLQNLLQPGVSNYAALRETLLDYQKYLSDSDFQSLTIAGMKKEILAAMERELQATTDDIYDTVYHWRKFCARFFYHWCKWNVPCGLLLDPVSGKLCLIRKGSLSLFRYPEDMEYLTYVSPDELPQLDDAKLKVADSRNTLELIVELLRCMNMIKRQLGRCAATIYYESFLSSAIPYNEIVSQLLKIMNTGYSPLLASSVMSLFGRDSYLAKMKLIHKSQRKFSLDMLFFFKTLYLKASSWTAVFDAIESYMTYLNPCKTSVKCERGRVCNMNFLVLVQATSQFARRMFESAFDLMLLLCYLLNVGEQVSLLDSDIARLRMKILPALQDIIVQWSIIYFIGTFPSTPPTIESFHQRLSSLNIGKADELSLHRRLGSFEFVLACLLGFPVFNGEQHSLHCPTFVNSSLLLDMIWQFSSSIWWQNLFEGSDSSSSPIIDLVSTLLCNSQYEAAEIILGILETYCTQRNAYGNGQRIDVAFCSRLHLHGFSLLILGYNEAVGVLKEQKINEAVRCFFRAASVPEAPHALQKFSSETGFEYHGICSSLALWRLHYYQWAMQMFEQYHMSDAACQLALAALEQVDSIIFSVEENESVDLPESGLTIRGRLWANVFKYKLDMKKYGDAYCAIVSNPDNDSKYVCLRRFIIVLCEHGATRVLCNGEIPFIGLEEKVEQELFWKAERSELCSKPNLYKVLYAFQAYRSNWRRAASYMYRYSIRLIEETSGANSRIHTLEEKLHALSATINALQLLDKSNGWLEYPRESSGLPSSKKSRNMATNKDFELSRSHYCVDVEILEKEYLMTSAQFILCSSSDQYKVEGGQTIAYLVDYLIQERLYDTALTIIMKLWKGSKMKSKLEQAFIVMAQECCPSRTGSHSNTAQLALSSLDSNKFGPFTNGSPTFLQPAGNDKWEKLELYLHKYIELHPRLTVIVAETLLYTDPQIELPLWLVNLFKVRKGGRRVVSLGMTGLEADSATLFRLYVDYGRYVEATNLLIEYLEMLASLRPADVIRRKKMSAVWFPYTAVEKLWGHLDKLQNSGRDSDHCDKLKQLLRGALVRRLDEVVRDYEDLSSVAAA